MKTLVLLSLLALASGCISAERQAALDEKAQLLKLSEQEMKEFQAIKAEYNQIKGDGSINAAKAAELSQKESELNAKVAAAKEALAAEKALAHAERMQSGAAISENVLASISGVVPFIPPPYGEGVSLGLAGLGYLATSIFGKKKGTA